MGKTAVDVCCDLGESFGIYSVGHDEGILDLISSANVACGFHAGDPHVIRKTISMAKERGVRVGAHPGLPDLIGFGRRTMLLSPAELKDIFTYQLGALKAFVEAAGMKLQHVIQHGALTQMAENNEAFGRAILESIQEVDRELLYLTLGGSYLPTMAQEMGIRIVRLAFIDRAYDRNMRLVSRKTAGAVIHDLDLVKKRVEQLVSTGTITTIEGEKCPLEFDSIMLHGDTPGALDIAETVAHALKRSGVRVQSMSELV
jgi:5-oxoprolinase (ATP-hydrolysing) subunit A